MNREKGKPLMKNRLIVAVTMLLVISTALLTGCADEGYEMVNNKVVMEHDYGIRYTNCFACHAGGLYPVPEAYRAMPIEVCTGACHIEKGVTVVPTTTIPPTGTGEPTTTPTGTGEPTTTPTGPAEPPVISSHGAGLGYDGLCLICHGPGTGDTEFPIGGPNDHTDRTNDECYDCHEVAQ